MFSWDRSSRVRSGRASCSGIGHVDAETTDQARATVPASAECDRAPDTRRAGGPGRCRRAEDDRVHAELVQVRTFGAEGHRTGSVTGEPLSRRHQPRIGRRLGTVRCPRSAPRCSSRGRCLRARAQDARRSPRARVQIHARQRPDVDVQLAVRADAVRIVAAVDVAEVQRRHLDRELRIAVARRPGRASPAKLADRRGVCPSSALLLVARVRGADRRGPGIGSPPSSRPCRRDRLQPGRLADHRVAPSGRPAATSARAPRPCSIPRRRSRDHQRPAQVPHATRAPPRPRARGKDFMSAVPSPWMRPSASMPPNGS